MFSYPNLALLLGVFLFVLNPVLAQHKYEPNFVHFTVEHGLPSSEVYNCFQDSKKNIWFCTDNGVSRFDGNSFENFTDQNGLYENTIFKAKEDREGKIWFKGFKGSLSVFSYGNRQMSHSAYNTIFINKLRGSYLRNFEITTDFIYWYSYNSVVWNVNRKTGDFTKDKLTKPGLHMFQRGPDPDQIVMYSVGNQYDSLFFVGDKGTEKQCFIPAVQGSRSFTDVIEKKGIYYILERKALFKYNNLKNSVEYVHLEVPGTPSLYIDKQNDLWVGTERSGVFKFENCDLKRKTVHLLPQKTVTSILEDHEGGFWFSTLHDGVYYVQNMAIFNVAGIHEKINQIITVNENVFSGTYNGHLYKSTVNDDTVFTKKMAEYPTEINNLLKYKKAFFLQINGEPVAQISRDGKQMKSIPNTSNISHIQKGKQLYMVDYQAGKNNVALLDEDGKKVSEFPIKKEDKINKVRKMVCTANFEQIYLGSISGLHCLNKDGDLVAVMENGKPLEADIRALELYSGDTIIVGTQGQGVLMVSNGTVLKKWDITSGLRSNACLSLSVDKDKGIWIGTTLGLHFIERPSGNMKIKAIGKGEGLVADMVYAIAQRDSIVFVGTSKGISYFNRKLLNKKDPLIHVSLKAVEVNGKVAQQKEVYTYDQNNLKITYGATSFSNALHIPYAYRLLPSKSKWTLTKSTEVFFPSLTPGNYRFEVRAANSNLNWGSITGFSFAIHPPFWKKAWFIVLVSFVAALSVFLYVLLKLKRVRLKYEMLAAVNRSKNKMLSAQLNPHFIFNSLNAVGYYTAISDNKTAIAFLSKYTKLIRQVFDHSNETLFPLEKEIAFLNDYLDLEKKRFKGKMTYELEIDPKLDDHYYFPPLLTQPFVENAIWHGASKTDGIPEIKISFTRLDTEILCCISDNGPGFSIEKTQAGKHSGTGISKKRMKILEQLLNKKVRFDVETQNGTTVKIYFPIITAENKMI